MLGYRGMKEYEIAFDGFVVKAENLLGGVEGLHQLLEALAFHAAKQRLGGQAEAVEGDLVFLHAAIAEHFDFAARHALGGERISVCATRLLRQKHR